MFLTNVLHPQECQEWIAFAKAQGFSPASLIVDESKDLNLKIEPHTEMENKQHESEMEKKQDQFEMEKNQQHTEIKKPKPKMMKNPHRSNDRVMIGCGPTCCFNG